MPGPHTAVWNVDALATSKEIILCEALFDAMTFWAAGFPHVITSYGVSGFTEAHRAALRLYGTRARAVAYDADEAGDRGAEHVADELTRMGIECYRVHFPRGLDANAYALAEATNATPSESLGVVLRAATWLGRGAPIVARGQQISTHASSLAAALPASLTGTDAARAHGRADDRAPRRRCVLHGRRSHVSRARAREESLAPMRCA